ncbi:MAG: hypothetical protein MJK04_18865, partial [Psychrosphaera sp.]|nr:hypothetical protein [Psychrosphaera sp.]
MLFKQMFLFEWGYFTRQPSFYITTTIFFVLGFLTPSAGMSHWGSLLKNGPYLITFLLLFLGLLSMFLVVNFVADTAMRDKDSGMDELLYCKPLGALQYQLGRFFGAFAVVVAVYAVVPLGMLLGSLMPWVDSSRFGPVHLSYYLVPFLILSVPTLFVFSCLFYALAIRFKSIMAVYLSIIAVFICYEVSGTLFGGVQTRQIGALLDPFALRTFAEVTRYWTVEQKNTQMLELSGILLMNRLLWLSIGLMVLAVFGRLSGSLVLWRPAAKKAKKSRKSNKPIGLLLRNRTDIKGQFAGPWQKLWTNTRFEVSQVVFHPAFYLLLVSTFIILISVVIDPAGLFGNTYWPTTQTMVEFIRNAL